MEALSGIKALPSGWGKGLNFSILRGALGCFFPQGLVLSWDEIEIDR